MMTKIEHEIDHPRSSFKRYNTTFTPIRQSCRSSILGIDTFFVITYPAD